MARSNKDIVLSILTEAALAGKSLTTKDRADISAILANVTGGVERILDTTAGRPAPSAPRPSQKAQPSAKPQG